LVVAMVSVAIWSVAQAQPGWIALATALLVMVGAFAAPCVLPTPLFHRRQAEGVEDELTRLALSEAVAQGLWLYLGTGAGIVAVAYAPPVPGLAWAVQFAWGLLLLAAVWTVQGLRLSGLARPEATARSAALLNSVVLYLGVCLGVGVVLGLPDVT